MKINFREYEQRTDYDGYKHITFDILTENFKETPFHGAITGWKRYHISLRFDDRPVLNKEFNSVPLSKTFDECEQRIRDWFDSDEFRKFIITELLNTALSYWDDFR